MTGQLSGARVAGRGARARSVIRLFETTNGRILKHLRIGHAQTQSVGRYRTDLPGLQILIGNFWRNTGIVTLLDPEANILAQDDMIPGSSHLEPVNWRGDGQEFALLRATSAKAA